MDLLAVIGIAMLLVPLVAFTEGPSRVGLGALLVFVLPGYSLLAALFPRRHDLPGFERLGLTIVMSLVLVPLIGLGVDFTPWGVRPIPLVLAIAGITSALTGVSLHRRIIASCDGYQVDGILTLHDLRHFWRSFMRTIAHPSSAIVVVAATVLVVAVLYVTIVPKTMDTFTEFYVLGADGTFRDYPRAVTTGSSVSMLLVLANREGKPLTYQVRVLLDDVEVDRTGPIQLNAEQTWQRSIVLHIEKPSPRQEAKFLLYVSDNRDPYRSLHVWLDVRDSR